jgi:alpha-L-rhamnosidase
VKPNALLTYDLRVGNSWEQPFIGESEPNISWKTSSEESDVRILGYEIAFAHTFDLGEITFTTGEIESECTVNIEWPTAALKSRQILFLRVRTNTNKGWSEWSSALRIEASLLVKNDWSAMAISNKVEIGEAFSPPVLFRKVFNLETDPDVSRLYVTAQGIFDFWINGTKVNKSFLDPGWTDYRYELPVKTYDLVDYLVKGPNVISCILADGWFRGQLSWECIRNYYGVRISLIAQLEVECNGDRVAIVTDETWKTSDGEIRFADLYDGTKVDFNFSQSEWKTIQFDDSNWNYASSKDLPSVDLVPATIPSVLMAEVLRNPTRLTSAEGLQIFDFGKILTGWVRLKVKGNKGSIITVKHAEILDGHCNLYTKILRRAKATDTYTLSDSSEIWLEPSFTLHGFQYAQVDGDVDIVEIEAVFVHSAIKQILDFNSSNSDINALMSNIMNSQRCNFISIPTDCPQRDERLGWTGDIQSFSRTAVNFFDCEQFLRSWLRQLEHSQFSDGSVTNVVPHVLDFMEFGNAAGVLGWGDAATVVPWNIYMAYKDEGVLRGQLSSMRNWVEYLRSQVDENGFLFDTTGQIGDWLDPDAPTGKPDGAKANTLMVMNSFYAHSVRILSKSYEVLGMNSQFIKYHELAERIVHQVWSRWSDEFIKTTTGCAIAIEFAIAPLAVRAKIANSMAALVHANGGKASFGLLGVPRVLPALSRNGEWDAAFALLLNRECPGWMFQVHQGASTVWERWDAIKVDGTIYDEPHYWKGEDVGMLSFNHYHLGSIGDWIVENIGGLALEESSPGYQVVNFAPHPHREVSSCSTRLDTPFGLARVDWETNVKQFSCEIEIPVGSTGVIKLPIPDDYLVDVNNQSVNNKDFQLPSGIWRVNAYENV